MTRDSRKQAQSRRRFLALGAGTAVAGIAAGPVTAQTPPPGGPLDETTIALINGKIHTMDAANTVVSTLTIRHNRIATVGGPAPNPAAASESSISGDELLSPASSNHTSTS
jgi:hypothetical protein